jgi:hypothetical protein
LNKRERSKEILQRIETANIVKRTKWGAAAVTLLIFLASWIGRPPNRQVPKELVGEWHTTDPNYADRTFELDPVCITFTTGGDTVSVGFIKEVKEVQEGNRILYTISYTVDDAPNKVSFYYDLNKGTVILFKNQERVVWRKDQDS